MSELNQKEHWEDIYDTKALNEVSWYEPTPEISLQLIENLSISKSAKIIDIGGGDSFLVDNLLALGYQNITVLDISKNAIQRAKKQLGTQAKNVKWIVADAANFNPTEMYDLWHDRAAFHFLTQKPEIENYVKTAENGFLIIGTFAKDGPEKCSGIEIKQYSKKDLTNRFETSFKKLNCQEIAHKTPFGTTQNFVFCSFKRI
jgi:SAM-dependent methyltransferase